MLPAEEIIAGSQQLVIDIFRSFRSTLLEHYGSVDYTLKSDHSQVTELDIRIETTLRGRLAEAYPSLGYAGEETGYDNLVDGAPFWLVDPIDSTRSFIRGLPNCSNMAALIVDGQPVASVIYDFVTDVLYTARLGAGAYKDGVQMHVVERALDDSILYIDSFRMPAEYRHELRAKQVGVYRPVGASGRAYTLVAEGKIDGYSLIEGFASPHDNAPGMLLVKEAGGAVATKDGRPWHVFSKDFVVGTPVMATFFAEMFKQQG